MSKPSQETPQTTPKPENSFGDYRLSVIQLLGVMTARLATRTQLGHPVDGPKEDVDHLRNVFEHLSTNLLTDLGKIAQAGATQADLDAVYKLGDSLEELSKLIEAIYAEITLVCDSQDTPETPQIIKDRLGVAEQLLLNTPLGFVHIDEIIKKAFAGEGTSPDAIESFLEHLANSPIVYRVAGNYVYRKEGAENVHISSNMPTPDSNKSDDLAEPPFSSSSGKEPDRKNEAEPPTESGDRNNLAVIINFIYKLGEFSIKELRDALKANGIEFSADEYQRFKQRFPSLRNAIIAELEQKGKKAHWEISGEASGKKYQLIINNVPETPKAAVSDTKNPRKELDEAPKVPKKPVLNIPPPRHITEKREREAQIDALYELTVTNINSIGLPNDENGITKLSAAKLIAAKFNNVDTTITKAIVNRLCYNNILHTVGHESGMALVSLQPAKVRKPRNSKKSATESKDKKELNSKVYEDICMETIASLLELTHVQMGISFTVLVRSLSQKFGIDQVEIRKVIRKLNDNGIIAINKVTKTGGPYSTKRQEAVVKLASQEIKNRCKNDLKGVLSQARGAKV